MNIKHHPLIMPVWRRLGVFVFVMFFLYLGDGMIADFVPGFLQDILGSPLLMGIVMSSSSIVGLTLDLLFAKILPRTSAKALITLAIAGAITMLGLLYIATIWPWVLLLVLAMMVWGIFYEMFGFATQKYVVSIADSGHRAAVWGIIETFRALAYALGPLALGRVIVFGEGVALSVVVTVYLVGIVLLLLFKLEVKKEREVEHAKITIWHEIDHWRVLVIHIWPMVILGVLLGFVDAVFWTTGTIVNDALALQHPLGGFFMTTYMIAAMFVGVILGGREIRSGKKRLAEWLVLLSGIVLLFMLLIEVWWWYLIVVFVSTLLSATAWPLLDAVYTDLLTRMGREQVHMIGLRNASHSIAYIIGPIIAGFMAQLVGEIASFVYLGAVVVVTSVFLIIVTPRKIRLPQREMGAWD